MSIRFALVLLILLSSHISKINAQILHPVKWTYTAKQMGKNDAIILIKASIGSGWHIYSTKQVDGGPVKTSFVWEKGTGYEISGDVIEPRPIVRFEQAFNMQVSFFENEVIFRQKIKLKANMTTVKGKLNFMVCNDKQCLAPEDVDFEVPVKRISLQ